MALVENSDSKAMKEQNDNAEEEIYYRAFPDMKRRIDYEGRKVKFEVALPGVQKENIELKALPTWFYLRGRRGHMEYSANQSFGFKIVPEKTEAKYTHGLLQITAFMENPMDHAKAIQL